MVWGTPVGVVLLALVPQYDNYWTRKKQWFMVGDAV